MTNHIRLMFTAIFMGLFLVACGDDSTDYSQPESTTEESVMTEEDLVVEEINSVEGMTEEKVIAMWGKPDLTQTRTIDSLIIIHHEWIDEDGVKAVQFQDGVAKFSQTIPID